MWQFTPTDDVNKSLQVPFIEDARAEFAPYYSTSKTLSQAQAEVVSEMGKLNAGVIAFTPGVFTVNGQQRNGYRIEFLLSGVRGVIPVAGLPMRTRTDKKLAQVRVQALLNVRDWLKAAVTANVFSPGMNPLLPHLLGDGVRTVGEMMIEKLSLPAPKDDIKIEREGGGS